MSTLLLNVSSIRNFGDAIAVQDLIGIHVWNFACSPGPEPKSGAAFDSHPDITIFQDEVIDIFAFSSVLRLNLAL